MTTIEHAEAVVAPARTTFDHLSRFQNYPAFMRSVDQVTLDRGRPSRVNWTFSLGGIPRAYTIDTTVDSDRLELSWVSVSGPESTGRATVVPVDEEHCEVRLNVEFSPSGALEQLGDRLGLIQGRVGKDMHRFVEYVERGGHSDVRAADSAPSERLFDKVFPTDEGTRTDRP